MCGDSKKLRRDFFFGFVKYFVRRGSEEGKRVVGEGTLVVVIVIKRPDRLAFSRSRSQCSPCFPPELVPRFRRVGYLISHGQPVVSVRRGCFGSDFYYCRTYYKAERWVGRIVKEEEQRRGIVALRTCAIGYDLPRLVWTSLTTPH
jgi:hypothetical protein